MRTWPTDLNCLKIITKQAFTVPPSPPKARAKPFSLLRVDTYLDNMMWTTPDDDGSHKEERVVPSLGYVCTYILTIVTTPPMLTIIVVAIFLIFIIACAKLNCLIERRREEEDDGEDTRSQLMH